jgi:hypothetical protein
MCTIAPGIGTIQLFLTAISKDWAFSRSLSGHFRLARAILTLPAENLDRRLKSGGCRGLADHRRILCRLRAAFAPSSLQPCKRQEQWQAQRQVCSLISAANKGNSDE